MKLQPLLDLQVVVNLLFLKTLNRMNDLVEGVRIEGKVVLDGEDIYSTTVDTTLLRKKGRYGIPATKSISNEHL